MKIKSLTLALLASAAFVSCSDDFLQDKKSYDNVNEDAYNYYEGALGRLADIYSWCLPNASADPGHRNNSTGNADAQSKCTEEYCGFGDFVDPQKTIGTNGNYSIPDYFQGQANSIQTNAWGRIRNINDVIRGISGGNLSQEQKNELLGQAYFLRAWCYYNFLKWYGGVPIITEVLEANEGSFTPRASTKATIDFICADLDRANEMLAPYTTNGGWSDSNNYGRVTSGTALALKGRVLLLWASPIFNRNNDEQRWKDAYEMIKASIPVINSCGYGLAYENDPGTNASNWAKMFTDNLPNKEAVFITLHNNVDKPGPGAPDYRKYNSWEHGVRPSNAWGGGGKTPSAMMVDLFPMSDGKRPANGSMNKIYTTLDASGITYDESLPFMNRDPRFYRTFAFPGVRWTFEGDTPTEGHKNKFKGDNYELWNYVWYAKAEDRNNIESGNNYGPDGLLGNAKGFYIRKRSNDIETGAPKLYIFDASNGFQRSANPYMEIRYAEVLLNYAEAACGAGHMSEAVEQLKRIRSRVYPADKLETSLPSNLAGNQAACMAAVLYERQIELAYEGKRFDDMRRWMLFDGGVNVPAGAPSTWALTGWGGNTCSYLGFPAFNGQRRDNLEFRVKADYNNGLGADKYGNNPDDADPLKGLNRPTALNLKDDFSKNNQLENLKTFYTTYLERNKKKGDSYDSNHTELFIDFKPQFYILGFTQGVQTSNEGLQQTMGWNDYNTGGQGTFDPLAE